MAAPTGESTTRALRTAHEGRVARPRVTERPADRKRRLRRFLEEEVRPRIPPDVRGVPISKAEREEILGIGPEGFDADRGGDVPAARRPAAPDLADCPTCAVATPAGEPLLCTGEDLAKTDLALVA